MKNLVIAFSGMDCSGKSTQIQKVIALFQGTSFRVHTLWNRPYNTPFFDAVRSLSSLARKTLKRRNHSAAHISSQKQASLPQVTVPAEKPSAVSVKPKQTVSFVDKAKIALVMADYFINTSHWLRKLCRLYDVILCDRYMQDAFVDLHRQYPTCSFEEWPIIRWLKKRLPKPDLSIVFVIDAATQNERLIIKKENPVSKEYYALTRGYYDRQIQAGAFDMVIDGQCEKDAVFQQIKDQISQIL